MRRHLNKLTASILTVGAFAAASATACAFHTYLPERTVIDWLLETENVVLARPAPEDPFRFEAVEALEGTLEQADLPTLVDSSTRRRLAVNPDDTVLFARDGGGYGPFQRLAYVDEAYREMLVEVMAKKSDWIMGDDQARFQYFADLLGHPEPALRDLALRELDRASYDIFRSLELAPEAGPILRDLWRVDQIAFAPIRILLLGLSDDPAAREAIREGLEQAAKSGGAANTLGPYATALVELDGVDGVARLKEKFLLNQNVDGDALELAVEALAIHAGAGPEGLRAQILETLGEFIDARPENADMVARQFSFRYDFGMGPALEELMKSGRVKSARTLIPISAYVMTARSGPGESDRF